MDAQRFDTLAKKLAVGAPRRVVLRGLVAAAAGAGIAFGRAGSAGGQAALPPGAACTSTSECDQSGGPAVCAGNGIAADGALNCCRNEGGPCTTDGNSAGCCGELLCVAGVCTATAAGGLAPGAPCNDTTECSQAGGPVVCADNGLGQAAFNCCRYEAAPCAADNECCGSYVCRDNGIVTGALVCCGLTGTPCSVDAGCCDTLLCVDGFCGG